MNTRLMNDVAATKTRRRPTSNEQEGQDQCFRFFSFRRPSIGSMLCFQLTRLTPAIEKCWEEFVRSDGCRDESDPSPSEDERVRDDLHQAKS
jgi:hypothetical protein